MNAPDVLLARFTVPGEIVGWQRARLVRLGRTITHFTAKRTRNYQAQIKANALQARAVSKPVQTPVHLEIAAVLPTPASWPKWKRAMANAGTIRPTGKPDADNIAKSVLDALNGVLWVDDAQVVALTITKTYEVVGMMPGNIPARLRPGLTVVVRAVAGELPANHTRGEA